MIPDKYSRFRPDVNFIKRYMQSTNAASGSEVDANANVENKNIATMAPEIHKKANIYANRLMMHDKLKELYDEATADEYIRQLEAHEIYRNDEAGMPVGTPYCVSVSMYPFLIDGLKRLGGTSEPPRNLDSFCGGFVNLVFAVAAQFAGAVSTPEFLSYLTYFLCKEYGNDFVERVDEVVDLGNRHHTIRDIIHAKFQQIVYSLNQPAAARGSQSVFWNTAYFDKPYFDGLFEGFIFPDGTELKELWPQVNWLQREFMTWFNKERTKKILTFPVESFSLLNDGEDFVDKDSAAWVAKMYSEGHSFFTYTSDSVDSLSSCCYSGDTHVRVLDEKGKSCVTTFQKIADYPQYYVHKNGTIYVYSCGEYKPAKFVELPHQKVYEVKTKGRYMRVTADHRNWIVQSREPVLTKDLHIGDQLYAYNPHINNFELATIYDIREYKYNGNVFCFQMMDKHDDMFTLANGIHNYNCRLRNNLQENTFSYTLGAGGVATGSKCVITMNMNRLVQNAARNGVDLSEAVAEQTRKIHKYLRAFNEILKDMFNARMLQVYDAGFISLDKQYLTVGVNGLNEGAEFLGIKISDNEAYRNYINTVLKPIYDIDKQDREPGLMWNFELIPAENLGVKNAKWDKQDGYFSPRDCYNSYFYLVEDDTMSPQEKFRLHGKEYTQYCDGGSALHCNLDEHLSYEQYKFLMKYAVKTGCPYFTFNIPNTVCNDCGHISKHMTKKCEKCGSENIDYATRIIGYLKLISKWSAERQKESQKRYYASPDKVEVANGT